MAERRASWKAHSQLGPLALADTERGLKSPVSTPYVPGPSRRFFEGIYIM